MPIQDHKRKWMALLFWQFRRLPEQPDFPPSFFPLYLFSFDSGLVVVVLTLHTQPSIHYTYVHLSKANLQMKRWKKTSLLRTSNCVCSSKAHLTPIYIAFQCQQTSSSYLECSLFSLVTFCVPRSPVHD